MSTETEERKKNKELSDAEKAIEAIVNSTRTTNFGEVKVERRGDKIILPEGMSYSQAHDWLHDIEEAEETEVDISYAIRCYPLDGALALYKALMEIYGHVRLDRTPGFFGSKPPQMITIKTGVGISEKIEVPWGRMSLPGIEGYIESGISSDTLPAFQITGVVKRKYEGAIRKIVEKTEKKVKEESIYRGKAIRVDLTNVGTGNFHPVNDAPQFFNVRDIEEDDLILNRSTRFDLQVSIWNRLENKEALLANNVNLKHGTLLMGTYGTGKTMTAKVTARKAEDNDWTFIYVESPDRFADALRLAELYAPTVLFTEDIDKVMEGSDRDDYMNRILNTMDGVDTKETPIITVLTTNHPEKINKAFLRAGRIDSVIPMGKPDEETAIEFVRHYAADALAEDENLVEVGEKLAGFVPAFIDQAVEKAKQFAISREGQNIKGKVTADDLSGAADTLKAHQEMVADQQQPTEAEKTLAALQQVRRSVNGDHDRLQVETGVKVHDLHRALL